jgi:acyl-CoA synthetase (AMP-forming)/AMP-acid ligase II
LELLETYWASAKVGTVVVPMSILLMESGLKSLLKDADVEGAPLHLEHKATLNRLLPGRFYELYGLTEGFVTVLDKLDYHRKPASVGIPLPLFEMKILDGSGLELPPEQVGEICGKGPILMPGYYKRDDLTEKAIVDGWLHSGDLGYLDEDGFLYLVDRMKDMIISGGVNVYPRDIE